MYTEMEWIKSDAAKDDSAPADTKTAEAVTMSSSEWRENVEKLAADFDSQEIVRQAPRLPNAGLAAGAAALQPSFPRPAIILREAIRDAVGVFAKNAFAFDTADLPQASETFRAVGYGHGANLWKSVVKAYMDIGYEGILSIENEDPILAGPVGVERAAWVLKNVRNELLGA